LKLKTLDYSTIGLGHNMGHFGVGSGLRYWHYRWLWLLHRLLSITPITPDPVGPSTAMGGPSYDQAPTFIPNHKSKAVIHTYLAWQNEPGMPLGQAITARALNPEKK